jgi:NAD(P)-dependent dehydrogenase (short-subunit alcohol dehydrogenase family)
VHPLNLQRLFEVRGTSVLITGAASGIGRACAEAMAVNGARVTLADIDRGALDLVVGELATAGCDVTGETVDATDPASLKRAVDAAVTRYGRLDVVFANVGISGGPGFLKGDGSRNEAAAFEAVPLELWERVLDVNVLSVVKTLQAVVPQMKRQGGGAIVVTSSISASKTEMYVGASYVASKGAVGQLVRQAALELARYEIRVNAIAPGPVVTNIGGGRLKAPEARVPFERACPMHRVAVPEDIAGAALFLASPASRFITGAAIVIDGGVSVGPAD